MAWGLTACSGRREKRIDLQTRSLPAGSRLTITADAKHGKAALVLSSEPGEFSYPAAIQTEDSFFHITHTMEKKRGVKHVLVDPAKLVPKPFHEDRWPE